MKPDNPPPQAEIFASSQLSRAWVWGAAGLLVLGALFFNQAIFGLGLVLSAALFVAWGWARWCISNLSVERKFSHTRAFWGEEVTMDHVFVNNKPLPLPWLAVEDHYPTTLKLVSPTATYASLPRMMGFNAAFSLGWYERVTRHYRFLCAARGEHEFGPLDIQSGDIFGLFRRTAYVKTHATLLVYPRYVPVEQLGIPARQPFGDYKSAQNIVTDPLRLRAVREYAYGDNPRHIHWKATARRGTLQTRLFEPSATPQLHIFLNQDTFVHMFEGLDPQTLELAITVAASVANYALEEGWMVGLQVNAFAANSDRQAKIPPSRDAGQLTRILETLARIKGWSGLPMEALIRAQRYTFPRGATLVVVTGVVTGDLLDVLLSLRRAGHPVTLIEAVGSERAASNAAKKSVTALQSQGITYYLVEAVGQAETIESLVF
ncbi:MAG: DUF58 domain-containing protein [Chloroflexia bacterium]